MKKKLHLRKTRPHRKGKRKTPPAERRKWFPAEPRQRPQITPGAGLGMAAFAALLGVDLGSEAPSYGKSSQVHREGGPQ